MIVIIIRQYNFKINLKKGVRPFMHKKTILGRGLSENDIILFISTFYSNLMVKGS